MPVFIGRQSCIVLLSGCALPKPAVYAGRTLFKHSITNCAGSMSRYATACLQPSNCVHLVGQFVLFLYDAVGPNVHFELRGM